MSETTDTQPEGNDPTEQPGDGTPVNEVPDAPTVVDPTTEPDELSELKAQLDALKERVVELEDRETSPAPSEPAPAATDRFVQWDDHDEWGNPRVFFGVDLGEAPYFPGQRNVARLVPTRVEGYDPAILRPLES